MTESLVTMVGRVAGEVTTRRTGSEQTWARFRLAVPERRYDAEKRDWIEAHVSFVSVHCWRVLGDNVLATLKRGDPVIVHGRFRVYEHNSDQQKRLDVQIDARHVGLDMSRSRPAANLVPDERPVLAVAA